MALRYGLDILDLLKKCSRCGKIFSKMHVLSYMTRSLVLGRYNELKGEVTYLARLATNSGSACNKPIINIGCNNPQGIPAVANVQLNDPTSYHNLILPPTPLLRTVVIF